MNGKEICGLVGVVCDAVAIVILGGPLSIAGFVLGLISLGSGTNTGKVLGILSVVFGVLEFMVILLATAITR